MKYLLAIALGPVQDFIAAARRTQDFQAGSTLLAETAKTVAREVEKHGELIFPADADSDGPNKILVEIHEGGSPESIALEARKAAEKYLSDSWASAKNSIPAGVLDKNLAAAQISGFLEFYAAWVPLAGDYAGARRDVDRLLAGRKVLRNFAPPVSPTGRPKSPLDPSRDCVLGKPGDLRVPEACHQKSPLWLKTRETLDAVSLLKRIRGDQERMGKRTPSTSLMAVRAFLPMMKREAREHFEEICKLVDQAGTGVDLGDFLYPGRLDADDLKGRGLENEIRHLDVQRRELLRAVKLSEFPGYYAILAADGDRMGDILSRKNSSKEHREFSASLSDFANEAGRRINTEFQGHCIYTGGDDVLALLPVNQAIPCAASLAALFVDKIQGTLSAGVAIVHHMDPLRVSLDRARAAEHFAKANRESEPGRDSLAVALHTRGGEPLTVAMKWATEGTSATDDWQAWIAAFAGGQNAALSRGFPYELRNLAREFMGMDELQWTAMPNEARRILDRKQGGRSIDLPNNLATPAQWEAFAKKLVIARFLADYPTHKEQSQTHEDPAYV